MRKIVAHIILKIILLYYKWWLWKGTCILSKWRWKPASDPNCALQREKRNVAELPGLDSNKASQEIIDKALGKHITPITLKSTIKSNPLYSDIQLDEDWEEKKKTPSWTVQDYDRHSLHSNLASHIKVTHCCSMFEQSKLLWAVWCVHEPLHNSLGCLGGILEVNMDVFSGTEVTLTGVLSGKEVYVSG